MNQKRSKIIYSEAFKRSVVEDIETGVMNANEAARFYGLGGGATIYRWLATYGMNAQKGRKVHIMTPKEETENIALRKELALVKKELEEARFSAMAWKSMVDAIEIDLNIPVKKKLLKQALLDAKSKLYQEAEDSVQQDIVKSMESPSKPDISVSRPLKRKKNSN